MGVALQHIAQTQSIASLRMLPGVLVVVYTKDANVKAQVDALGLGIEVSSAGCDD